MEIVEYKCFKYNDATARIEGGEGLIIEKIRNDIAHDRIVILKSVFAADILDVIKTKVFEYFLKNKETNPEINGDTPNYHRIDNNPEKSAVKRIAHKYISFYWNEDLASETRLMKAMTVLKNKIAKLPEEFTVKGIDGGYITLSNITHYPIGGGRLNKHVDPENIQYTVMIASMSNIGEDYRSGGVYVEFDGNKEFLDSKMSKGDIFLFKPSLMHGVDDIDPDAEGPEWKSIKGRWILFPALVEFKSLQGEKVEGLRDLDYKN